jgi:hypothetical protein
MTTTVTKLPDDQIEISAPTLQRPLTFPTHDVFCGEMARLYHSDFYQPGSKELELVRLVQKAESYGSAESSAVEVADLIADMADRLGR